jgi:hypothetical protein
MNLSGHTLTAPERFRLSLEVILDSGLSKAEIQTKLYALGQECNREYSRAKSQRRNWDADYFRGNKRRVQQAVKLVDRLHENHGIHIPISRIYFEPEREPVNRLAATVVPTGR